MYPRTCSRTISSIPSQTTVDGSPAAGVVFLTAVISFPGIVPSVFNRKVTHRLFFFHTL
jgi:hypothetical protein